MLPPLPRRFFRLTFSSVLALALTSAFAGEGSPSSQAVADLQSWLGKPRESRPKLTAVPFATVALTKADAERAKHLLWDDHAAVIRATRQAEMDAKLIEIGGLRMKFETVAFGPKDPSAKGRSLFLSLHGGGGTAPPVNEAQWNNQVKLAKAYQPTEGIYLAPRAPTDTWDFWHQAQIDQFFARLIENLVVLERVNPDRVYLLGYSAGGDGVYQLGPRMADRWAAVAMMGGHPNEASPLGLRNIGFALQVGANDGAYRRNQVAAEWGRRLDELQKADPMGYSHFTELHEGKGHWMDLADRKAIPWMEKFTRDPVPRKVVWHQDDVTHAAFYWLAVPAEQTRAGQEMVAERQGQTISVTAKAVGTVIVRLSDAMLDLDQPVTIQRDGAKAFEARVSRTIGTLARTLEERGDPGLIFSAEVTLAPTQ